MSAGIRGFDGRVAVVTGGASGIGRGLVERLVTEGATVVIADNDETMATAAAAETSAAARVVDVRDAAAVQALADWTIARFGRVDFVANNAGVGPLAPFEDLTLDDFRWTIDINLYGVLHVMRAFLPLLKANPEGGHMLNTASMAGLTSPPGMSAYAATKFAVVGLTEVVRTELEQEGSLVGLSVLAPMHVRSNIAQNALKRPGLTGPPATGEADHLPEGTWIDPDEAARFILDAVLRNEPYIVTHPEVVSRVRERHERIEEAFARTGRRPQAESGADA